MAEELTIILNELKSIRKYLIKIGPSRRIGKAIEIKRNEANLVLVKYNNYLKIYKSQVRKYTKEEISLINKICGEFENIFTEVLSLCADQSGTGETLLESQIMAGDTFDLKIALSLFPVMTDEDKNTKQLIESIEYYDSVLTKPECKNKLIMFILKSRLSQQAKLKLQPKYDTVDELVKDMRRLLLPRKSYLALQTKLQHAQQDNKSILDFGKEISDLFVDLTVSQADGNLNSYNVLRPLNEKLAIKRFADGLRDRRLSTIIAARNYNSITEAVQAAQDEEVQSASGDVIGMYNSNYRYNSGRRPQRGQYRGGRGYQPNSRGHMQNMHRRMPPQRSQESSTRGNYRRNNNYNNGNYSGNRRENHTSTQGNMNLVTTEADDHDTVDQTSPNTETLNHFFRD